VTENVPFLAVVLLMRYLPLVACPGIQFKEA
jgi:hypothetical protein